MKTKPNLIHIFLLAGALPALPPSVQAQFIFTTNNGAITITQYTGPGGDVVIPDTINGLKVATVGSTAFYQISGLTSVTFGTNVTTIANNAIFQCPSLASVTIPASVTNIGSGPMIDCKSLTAISVSPSNSHYTNVNQVLFNKPQTSLIEFPGGISGNYTIPAAITNIGQAFIGNSLTSISVNSANVYYASTNGVLFDKSLTFLISYPGGALGSYAVPKGVTTIVSASFEYSTGVTNVTIGTNVSSIGLLAFYDCPNLTAIVVNSTNAFFSSTNGVLFDKNKTMLIQYPIAIGGSYLVPGTVVNIGDGAFGDAFGLTSIVVPNSVTNIAQQAFYGCLNLSSMTLGDSVKSMGPNACFLCGSLTDLVFPASLTNIGQYAFGGCQSLTNVCFEGNQPTDGGSVFYFDNALTAICYKNGTAGWGATYDGIPTAPCAECAGGAPLLTITRSGNSVIMSWPSPSTGWTLQTNSTMNAGTWVNYGGTILNNTLTNSLPTGNLFFRLTHL